MLWADDLLLASASASGLQVMLYVLSDYSDRWRLTVNSSKTKAVVFRRPNQQLQISSLSCEGQDIEPVKSCVNLGMRFHCTEAFINACIPVMELAERAVPALRSRCVALKLYDPVV